MGPENSKFPLYLKKAFHPLAILSGNLQGEKGVGKNMIVVSTKPIGATTKFTAFLFSGALNMSFSPPRKLS